MKSELRKIPGVGQKTEEDLRALGYTTIESLKGQDPQEMYERDCMRKGCAIDRCQLYVYRCAVYFAETEHPDPEKLKWWYWKDPPVEAQIVPAVQNSQLQRISGLAREIWNEHYAAILSQEQIDYMVGKFQSYDAICAQRKEEGYQYFLLLRGDDAAGYMGIRLEEDRLFLSKLYVLGSFRGCGVAASAMQYLEQLCRENMLRGIWLTVNKNNSGSIAAYERMGFHKAYEQTSDIGGGFVMDDYVMEKDII